MPGKPHYSPKAKSRGGTVSASNPAAQARIAEWYEHYKMRKLEAAKKRERKTK